MQHRSLVVVDLPISIYLDPSRLLSLLITSLDSRAFDGAPDFITVAVLGVVRGYDSSRPFVCPGLELSLTYFLPKFAPCGLLVTFTR